MKAYHIQFSAIGLAGIALLASVDRVQAATLDFEGLPLTPLTGGNIIPNPASVITDNFIADGVQFGRTGVSAGVAAISGTLAPSSGIGSIAALDAAGIIPGTSGGGGAIGDMFFNFVLPGTLTPAETNAVSFTLGDSGGDTDLFTVRAYNLADVLISSLDFSEVSRFPVSLALSGMHRIEVDFTGDFGYSLDDLVFNTPTTSNTSIPEPSSLLGLGVLSAFVGGSIAQRKLS